MASYKTQRGLARPMDSVKEEETSMLTGQSMGDAELKLQLFRRGALRILLSGPKNVYARFRKTLSPRASRGEYFGVVL
eukprot:7657822-Prorocentrum_lima.AAC.1